MPNRAYFPIIRFAEIKTVLLLIPLLAVSMPDEILNLSTGDQEGEEVKRLECITIHKFHILDN